MRLTELEEVEVSISQVRVVSYKKRQVGLGLQVSIGAFAQHVRALVSTLTPQETKTHELGDFIGEEKSSFCFSRFMVGPRTNSL